MATYKSITSGNWTSAATWGTVLGANNTETSFQQLTSTAVAATSFVGVGDTAEGILIKPMLILGTGAQISGTTIIVELYNVTTTTILKTVTINATDLNTNFQSYPSPYVIGNYIYLKFASTQTLTIGNSFAIRVKIGGTANASVYLIISTANNWNGGVVTTTTGNPTTGDITITAGAWTAAATSTAITVTMDNTATTSFGPTYIGSQGILTCESSASKNYYLKIAGNLYIGFDGTYSQGTSGTPVPSTSTYSLEFVSASQAQYGTIIYGTFNSYGASKTTKAKLAANILAGGTSLTTNVSTGWASGDILAIAGTTRTDTEHQKLTMSGAATGTTVPVNAVTVAKSGTAPTQADIINLTRNVKIFGQSTTNTSYIAVMPQTTSTITMFYTQTYFMGSQLTIGTTAGGSNPTYKTALNYASNTAILNCQYNSFYDGQGWHVFTSNTVWSGTFTYSNNVMYNTGVSATSTLLQETGVYIFSNAGATGTYTVDSNTLIRSNIKVTDVGGVVTNNTIANAPATSIISEIYSAAGSGVLGTFSGNTFYGSVNNFLTINCGGTISSTTLWGLSIGFAISNSNTGDYTFTIDGVTSFGHSGVHLYHNGAIVNPVIVKNGVFNGVLTGSALAASTYGLQVASADLSNLTIYNSTFSGMTVSDIGAGANTVVNVTYINCTFSSSVEFTGQASLRSKTLIYGYSLMNYQNVAGSYKSYDAYGIIQTDAAISNSATPSMRLTPNNAIFKLKHLPNKIAVKSGDAVIVSVYLRKSVVGDGTAYNGNQPRLMVRTNLMGGITTDTVLATATNSANGAWVQYSGTTAAVTGDCVLEFYVDCDGTLGWVNVDDWATTYYQDTRGQKYWYYGIPYVEMSSTPKERSFTFVS